MTSDRSVDDTAGKPFVVPCARLTFGSPIRWLRAGWQDLELAREISLKFGLAIWIGSIALSALAWYLGSFILLAALLSGFVFLAPLLAVGLYSVAKAHEQDREPALSDALRLARRV
ncbi:MAG: DUF2189 domain-containing protein, partial [Pseudomonadota bacterium]